MHHEVSGRPSSVTAPTRQKKMVRASASSFCSDNAVTTHSCHWQLVSLQARAF